MPFVFWAIADYNPNFVDPKQAFVNHSGINFVLSPYFLYSIKWCIFPSTCRLRPIRSTNVLQGSIKISQKIKSTKPFISQIPDCKIAFYNSPDFTWGDVEKGKVTGAYRDLLNDEVDIVSGCRAVSFGRYQVKRYRNQQKNGWFFFFLFLRRQ